MQYKHLGRTGLKVSRLCLGTGNFGPRTTEKDSYAIMDEALSLDINFFDTANVYGGKKGEGLTEQIVGRWLAQGGGRLDGPQFVRLTAERTGIDFVYQLFLPEDHNDDFATTLLWSGVCIGDYDDDGRPDIYLSRPHGGNRLYRNLGDFRFQDVTGQVGITDDDVWGMAGTFADLDNDGDLDLTIGISQAILLNNGDLRFTNATETSGIGAFEAPVAFFDYDLDGDLDGQG